MAKQSTGVTVTFTKSDAETILTLEDDSRTGDTKPPKGVAWIAVWSGGRAVSLSSTSGNPVTLANSAVTRSDSSTCSFSKSDTANIPHTNLSNVKVTTMGKFIGLKGETLTSVGLVVDTTTGVIRASQKCYGTVAVSYTTTYARYSCAFALDPNYDEKDPKTSKYAEMVVVGFAGKDDASITLTESESGSSSGFDPKKSEPDNSSAGTNIQIEISTPTYIAGSEVISTGYSCYVEIDVYWGNVESKMPVVSEGTIDNVVGSGPFEFVEIDGEQLFWANKAVANTKYLPIGTVWVTPISTEFTAKYESNVILNFESNEGGLTQPKVYLENSGGAYTLGPPRRTNFGDVIAMDHGLSVDVTGSATVKYTTNRKRYAIWWYRPASSGGVSAWFRPITVWVTSGIYSGNLVINPPSNKGNV